MIPGEYKDSGLTRRVADKRSIHENKSPGCLFFTAEVDDDSSQKVVSDLFTNVC